MYVVRAAQHMLFSSPRSRPTKHSLLRTHVSSAKIHCFLLLLLHQCLVFSRGRADACGMGKGFRVGVEKGNSHRFHGFCFIVSLVVAFLFGLVECGTLRGLMDV